MSFGGSSTPIISRNGSGTEAARRTLEPPGEANVSVCIGELGPNSRKTKIRIQLLCSKLMCSISRESNA